jgi:hypothetical protein
MDPMSETPAIIEFCRVRILPHRRELLGDGQPIRIGGRAFDVLMALIEARGAVLSKDALMSRVWPNRNVEQNALQAQISALRDLFGADRDLIRASASYLSAKNQAPTAGYAKAFQTGQLNLGHQLNFQIAAFLGTSEENHITRGSAGRSGYQDQRRPGRPGGRNRANQRRPPNFP